jgi:hypothetical protein
VLTVTAQDWLAFLGHVTAGSTDRDVISAPAACSPAACGPFLLSRAHDSHIEVRCGGEADSPVVRYTPQEWDVFVAGATRDGEFTLDWLRSPPATS